MKQTLGNTSDIFNRASSFRPHNRQHRVQCTTKQKTNNPLRFVKIWLINNTWFNNFVIAEELLTVKKITESQVLICTQKTPMICRTLLSRHAFLHLICFRIRLLVHVISLKMSENSLVHAMNCYLCFIAFRKYSLRERKF